MLEVVAIAIGGALGAVARFSLVQWINAWLGTDFPWGILIVNISGSFVIGVLFVLFLEHGLGGSLTAIYRSVLMVGFLGAFTTFSTFSLQTLALLETGRSLEAAAYVLGSVLLSLVGVTLGVFLCRQLTGHG